MQDVRRRSSRQSVWVSALLLTLFGLWIAVSAHAATPQMRPGEVLVGVKAARDTGTPPAWITAMGQVLAYNPSIHVYRVKIAAQASVLTTTATLSHQPDAAFAEPNYIVHALNTPNDTFYSLQYIPQVTHTDQAWNVWRPKATIIIAILDTGVDSTHPDLTNKMLRDTNGQVIGYDATTGQSSTAMDGYGHGTHCAGIAAAQVNNGQGVAGIAGWDGQASDTDTASTKLMPVRVLGSDGSGTDADVAAGVTWAADHGARVISMSLGDTTYTYTLNAAIQYAWGKGCFLCAAAGNDGLNQVNYPAGYANVVPVAATDSTDTLTSYSNYGSWVPVAAPGGDATNTDSIYSTTPTYDTGQGIALNYDYLSGTSMATPVVAGEAALLWAQNPSLTNAQITSLILTNVDPYNPAFGHSLASTAGRVNIYKALVAATPPSAPSPPPDLIFQNSTTGQIAEWFLQGQSVNGGALISGAPAATNLTPVGFGDFNGDGNFDLVLQNRTTGQVIVWYLNGTTFLSSATVSLTPQTGWSVVGVGDFNGDGHPDLVFQNQTTGQIGIWLMNGVTFTGSTAVRPVPASGYRVVGVGDFNGDGQSDLVFQNQTTGQVALWYLNGSTYIGGALLPQTPASGYRVVAVGDFNGDGNPDLVFQNQTTGQVALWLMNGTAVIGGGLTYQQPLSNWLVVGPR